MLPELANIKAVLFDLDGVLMMSNNTHAHAYQLAFEAEGIVDFNHTEISGMRTDEVVDMVLKRNGRTTSDAEIARVTAIKRAHAKRLFAENTPVIDGCNTLLQRLSTSCQLALCTSASRNTADAFLDHANNRSHFEFVICGPEVEQSKPHPEIYQRAMQHFAVDPTACVVVEDSRNGIVAGKAAGAHVVAVEGTFAPGLLLKEGALHVLPSATALPALLGLS